MGRQLNRLWNLPGVRWALALGALSRALRGATRAVLRADHAIRRLNIALEMQLNRLNNAQRTPERFRIHKLKSLKWLKRNGEEVDLTQSPCANCRGSGTDPLYNTPCIPCNGTGLRLPPPLHPMERCERTPDWQKAASFAMDRLLECRFCDGSGIGPDFLDCKKCQGSGSAAMMSGGIDTVEPLSLEAWMQLYAKTIGWDGRIVACPLGRD